MPLFLFVCSIRVDPIDLTGLKLGSECMNSPAKMLGSRLPLALADWTQLVRLLFAQRSPKDSRLAAGRILR
jgi:hypothetical protein